MPSQPQGRNRPANQMWNLPSCILWWWGKIQLSSIWFMCNHIRYVQHICSPVMLHLNCFGEKLKSNRSLFQGVGTFGERTCFPAHSDDRWEWRPRAREEWAVNPELSAELKNQNEVIFFFLPVRVEETVKFLCNKNEGRGHTASHNQTFYDQTIYLFLYQCTLFRFLFLELKHKWYTMCGLIKILTFAWMDTAAILGTTCFIWYILWTHV